MTTLDLPLLDALTAVGTLMNAARDPWWIIAGAAVALHGADAGHVADVDVLLSVEDARHILPSIGLATRVGSEHADFRSSIFGTWTATALPVEFMAGFSHRSRAAWRPVRPISRDRIALGSVAVFVPGRVELCEMLRNFGRPKDIERADRLETMGR